MRTLAAPCPKPTAEHPRLQVVPLRTSNGREGYFGCTFDGNEVTVLSSSKRLEWPKRIATGRRGRSRGSALGHGAHGFRIQVEKTAPAAHGLNEAEPYQFVCKNLTTDPTLWHNANLVALGTATGATASQFLRSDGSAAAVCETLVTPLALACASRSTMKTRIRCVAALSMRLPRCSVRFRDALCPISRACW
jgi:hypothetical protein